MGNIKFTQSQFLFLVSTILGFLQWEASAVGASAIRYTFERGLSSTPKIKLAKPKIRDEYEWEIEFDSNHFPINAKYVKKKEDCISIKALGEFFENAKDAVIDFFYPAVKEVPKLGTVVKIGEGVAEVIRANDEIEKSINDHSDKRRSRLEKAISKREKGVEKILDSIPIIGDIRNS